MATIGTALVNVKDHLDQWLTVPQIEQCCRDAGHCWRKRKLDPPTTVHLFLLQLLAGVAMGALRHLSKINASAQAICAAKKRLPLAVLRQLVGLSGAAACPPACWKGHAVCLADALSFLTADTPELEDKYHKASNQRGKSKGRPMPKLLAMLDRSSGLIQKIITLPCCRQERVCLSRLYAAMPAGAILLGDRGLSGFGQVAMMLGAKVQGCLRLPRWLVVQGRGRQLHRRQQRLAKQDLLVCWRRGRGCAWMSKRRWSALPEQLILRQIAFRITRPGFRTHWAWIITTLIDPLKYPAADLVELYGKRWQVEVCFRDLKKTLGMKLLSSRSLEGVAKEVLAFVLLYNLVRQVMLKAAAKQNVEADRISFSDARIWLLWSSPGEELAKLKINPRRKRPTQPRAVKQARKRYTQLNQSRAQLLKPPCEAKL
jgi:hypothetical protein